MFDNLQAIDWANLNHAYGAASNVPGLLWALASSKRRDRKGALESLYSNIWHQGTVYEATSFAVPFLCELLRPPSVQGRTRILGLLQAIALAYPRSDTRPDPLWRELPSAREITQSSESAHWARQANQAVSAEVSTFMTLLADPDALVRIAAAFTLACCGNRFAEIGKQMQKHIDGESSAMVKGALIHVWTGLWKKSGGDSAFIKKKLRQLALDSKERTLVRLISAMGLLQFLPQGTHPKLARFLASALRRSAKAVGRLNLSLDESLASHHDVKLAVFLDLAQKPGRVAKQHILSDLQMLCRERRSNFATVIPAMGQILRHGDLEFRRKAVFELSQMGTWVRFAQEPLAEALQDADSNLALWSAQSLSKLRDPRVLPFLLDRLAPEKHIDPSHSPITETTPIRERLQIQQAVGKHLNGLRLLLDALRRYGPAGREMLPHLRVLLVRRGADIQKMICSALAHIGPPAEDTVPSVAKLLRVSETQNEAAWAIAHWGLTATKAIPDLIEFLKDFPEADSWARISAIQALGSMGAYALDALPILTTFLGGYAFQAHHFDAATRSGAALAVWRIGPRTPGVIEVLIDELKERMKPGWATHGCSQVVSALEAIGPAAKSAEFLLQKLLADSDGWSRIHAARALWKIGTPLDVFLPVLINDLLCRPLGVSAGLLSAECLTEIGPPAMAAVPRIKQILATEASLVDLGSDWVEKDEAYQDALKLALRSITCGSVDV